MQNWLNQSTKNRGPLWENQTEPIDYRSNRPGLNVNSGLKQPQRPIPTHIRIPITRVSIRNETHRWVDRVGYRTPSAHVARDTRGGTGYPAPGHAALGHAALGHAASGYAASGHVASGHAALGYATAGDDTFPVSLGTASSSLTFLPLLSSLPSTLLSLTLPTHPPPPPLWLDWWIFTWFSLLWRAIPSDVRNWWGRLQSPAIEGKQRKVPHVFVIYWHVSYLLIHQVKHINSWFKYIAKSKTRLPAELETGVIEFIYGAVGHNSHWRFVSDTSGIDCIAIAPLLSAETWPPSCGTEVIVADQVMEIAPPFHSRK